MNLNKQNATLSGDFGTELCLDYCYHRNFHTEFIFVNSVA